MALRFSNAFRSEIVRMACCTKCSSYSELSARPVYWNHNPTGLAPYEHRILYGGCKRLYSFLALRRLQYHRPYGSTSRTVGDPMAEPSKLSSPEDTCYERKRLLFVMIQFERMCCVECRKNGILNEDGISNENEDQIPLTQL
jgi:hypothetical protein